MRDETIPTSVLPFRRGGQHLTRRPRKIPGYERLYYTKLGPNAERCFKNLVEYRLETGNRWITLLDSIRAAMSDKPLREGWRQVRGRPRWGCVPDVSPRYANFYRRAWDALGLVNDFPGEWNPEKFDRPRFDHASLGEGYYEYTDWSDLNDPAVLEVVADDPDAYANQIKGHDIYVLNRALPACMAYDNEAVAYGDIGRARHEWLMPDVDDDGDPIHEGVPLQVYDIYKKKETMSWQWDGTPLGLLEWLTPAKPPTPVLLVEKPPNATVLHNRRSRSPRCLMADQQRPLSVPEMHDLDGTPRRTLYNWIENGKLLKLSDGQYWCVCHELPDGYEEPQ